MSMMWMRMPGQSWPGAAASFLAMWLAMSVAMMLPSLVPMLWRFRRSLAHTRNVHDARLGWLTALVSAGYFLVWTGIGVVLLPIAIALSALLQREPALARAAPVPSAGVVLVAGLLQLTRWKAHRIAAYSDAARRARTISPSIGTGAALRYGVRLGAHCARACGTLMAISLVVGAMDFRVMTVVTAAITAERVAPNGARVSRGIGIVAIAAGVALMVRAASASGGSSLLLRW